MKGETVQWFRAQALYSDSLSVNLGSAARWLGELGENLNSLCLSSFDL